MASIPSLHETRPTRGQWLAMEKMLTGLLGANEFGRLYHDIKVGAVNGDILRIFAPTEICAANIKLSHLEDFAVAAAYAFGRPIRIVNILPADSDSAARQPAIGMEYVVDVLDFADGTGQHCSADAANGDEVRESIRIRPVSYTGSHGFAHIRVRRHDQASLEVKSGDYRS